MFESQATKKGDMKPPFFQFVKSVNYLTKPFAIALYPAPTTYLGALPVL